MAEYSVKAWHDNDVLTLHDVQGTKHPDGKSYTIPAPSALDDPILLKFVDLELRQGKLSDELPDVKPDDQSDEDWKAQVTEYIAKMGVLTAEHDALLDQFDRDEHGETISHEEKMLGPAYAEMIADGVSPRLMKKFGGLATTHFGRSEQAARAVVAMAEGEALARSSNRAQKRAAAKAAKRPSSPRKAGTSSPRVSGGKNTQDTPAPTRGTATSAAPVKKAAAAKTA